MGLTDSSRFFATQVQDIDGIMAYCREHFERRNYAVTTEKTMDGGFVSLTNGGIFKTISGMKTGLNITISQMPGAITVSMKIGLFGKQLIPSAIAMLVFWPVLIPQIYGLVQQSKLDTEAYSVIEAAIREREQIVASIPSNTEFCVFCGATIPKNAIFCAACGKRVEDEAAACPQCGAEISSGAVFCHKCGTRI